MPSRFHQLQTYSHVSMFFPEAKKDGLSRPFGGRAQVPQLAANYSE